MFTTGGDVQMLTLAWAHFFCFFFKCGFSASKESVVQSPYLLKHLNTTMRNNRLFLDTLTVITTELNALLSALQKKITK